ncbi:Guard cell S-type anion channel SLAC1 [Platanthera zijinensis]|uniref:Guard cell S-type anion channel SLAC1 n=1 Tax=Platanthera zijinensis TaxID=2320716 RepID=A0AAP0G964_9ASPA
MAGGEASAALSAIHCDGINIRPDESAEEAGTRKIHQRPQGMYFGRQGSLETGKAAAAGGGGGGFSPRGSKDRRSLSRKGKSLGPATETSGGDGVRKGDDFRMFRTKSSLHRQLSMLPTGKESGADNQNGDAPTGGGGGGGGGRGESINQSVPAGRYFAALRGPELNEVKESEDILLPKDELWPFLLRFPVNCFGICLGLGSQTILWSAMTSSPAISFLRVTPFINTGIWLLALLLLAAASIAYALKAALYFEAVRREYFHPVRLNFFFAPWIAGMFLVNGAPPSLAPPRPHPAVWCALMAPVFFLEVKIYGQWLSGGKRRLCMVANPSSHLSVVGNFVGAGLAARVGWPEAAKFLWAVGIAHYLCVFVTLYQRLPTSEALPKELHPVYCMFIATPAAASLAWNAIYGEFDAVARTFYFIALFLYVSLIVRINFFRGFKFSVAWWSYTFPMTMVSVATIRYAEEVPTVITKGLALVLTFISSTIVLLLFVSTLLHGFVWGSLFPNDPAIAISRSKNCSSAGKRIAARGRTEAMPHIYDEVRRWARLSLVPAAKGNTKNKSDDN